MKIVTIFFFVLGISTLKSYAQNPLSFLKQYRYDIDNNEVNFEKELEQNSENLVYTNVFFRYFKNALYSETFNSYKIMLFRLNYERLIQVTITDSTKLKFTFPKSIHEKTIQKKVYLVNKSKEELKQKVLKKKYYNTMTLDSLVVFTLDKNELLNDKIVRIYLKTESANFNQIHFSKLNLPVSSRYYFTLNIPTVFNYQLKKEKLKSIDVTEHDMTLIQFSYEYLKQAESTLVTSRTHKWIQEVDFTTVNFPLIYIRLPERIGTNTYEIMQN